MDKGGVGEHGNKGVKEVGYALDAVSERGSYGNVCKVLKEGGPCHFDIAGEGLQRYSEEIKHSVMYVGSVHLDPDEDECLREQA